MLRFFRVNDPYRLLVVLGLVFLVGSLVLTSPLPPSKEDVFGRSVGYQLGQGLLLYAEVWCDLPPIAALLHLVADSGWGHGITAKIVLALMLLFVQGALLGVMLINARAFNEGTYLPALLLVTFSFFSWDAVHLSPALLSSTFLLLALRPLLREIEFKAPRDSSYLYAGIWLSLASLTVTSHVLFFPVSLLLLLLFAQPNLRKLGLLCIGFALPHGVLIAFYFWHDQLAVLGQHYYAAQWKLPAQMALPRSSMWVLGALPMAYLIFSLLMTAREARFTRYQTQLWQALLLWLMAACGAAFLSDGFTPALLLPAAAPLAYLVSHYLLLIRRRWLAELSLWGCLVGVPLVGALARHGYFVQVQYEVLAWTPSPRAHEWTGKSLAVWTDDMALYGNHRPATFFLDWRLAAPAFADLDRVHTLVTIDRSFRAELPDVIVDPQGYFPVVRQRLPWLGARYESRGDHWIRISN